MRLPIQELKLDQVFIRDLRVNAESRVLVEAILMLAKAKGLRGLEVGHVASSCPARRPVSSLGVADCCSAPSQTSADRADQ